MTSKWNLHLTRAAALLLAVLASSGVLFAYSVLTHEEIVDLVWTSDIHPLLLQRFPDLTADEIKEAHAYAYGGSVIQDLGYYPFGSKDFSDLVHYVRSWGFRYRTASSKPGCQRVCLRIGCAIALYVGY